MKYTYKYLKKFETCDEIGTEKGVIDYDHADTYPFVIILDDNEIYFGNMRSMHCEIDVLSGNAYLNSDEIQGRVYINEKVISFWNIDIWSHSDRELFELIEDKINNDITDNIDFFDGEWRIEISLDAEDEDDQEFINILKNNEYFTIDGLDFLVPINDYISGVYSEYKPKVNQKAYNIHLLKAGEKNKALKDMGAKPKVRNWKEWQKPFEAKINECHFDDVLEMKHLKNFETTDYKSNIITFDYVAKQNDYKGNPILYVTNFVLVSDNGEKVECKVRGYQYTDIEIEGGSKKGWVNVNDFDSKRTHLIHKKDFEEGTARRKINNITI